MLQGFAADDAFLILAKGIFGVAQGVGWRGRERERKCVCVCVRVREKEKEREKERESRGWQFPVITANPYFIA